MTKKINLILGIFTEVVLIVFMVSFVSAYGISAPVWKGHPLVINPGETKSISLFLQNMVSDDDERVEIELRESAGIASVREGEYLVPGRTKSTEVLVTITIPEGTPIGTLYEVVLGSSEIISGSGAEGVQLSVSTGTILEILVSEVKIVEEAPVEEESTINSSLILIVSLVGIAAVIIIIIYLMRKNRSMPRRKK